MNIRDRRDEDSRRMLPGISEYYDNLCQLINGDTESVPSWYSREQCIVSTCDSLVGLIKYIKKQYE